MTAGHASRVLMRRTLAGTALGLGMLALLVGDGPAARESVRVPSPDRLPWIDEYDDAPVDAVTVAVWLRDRRPGLSVLDVRPAPAYADFHLPRAANVPPSALAGVPADSAATVVVYGDTPADAQRAWVILRAFGHPDVRALEEGIRGWLVDVMNPVLPPPVTAADSLEFDRRANLSRYFGGLPRLGEPMDASGATEEVLTRMRRRGCAF